MFIPATKYILDGFSIYLDNIKESASLINIRITYSEINPILEWITCANQKLIYDEDRIVIFNQLQPQIININYTIVKGYYTIDISHKNGLYVIDNQVITIGLIKQERNVHINYPQSAYKLI